MDLHTHRHSLLEFRVGFEHFVLSFTGLSQHLIVPKPDPRMRTMMVRPQVPLCLLRLLRLLRLLCLSRLCVSRVCVSLVSLVSAGCFPALKHVPFVSETLPFVSETLPFVSETRAFRL